MENRTKNNLVDDIIALAVLVHISTFTTQGVFDYVQWISPPNFFWDAKEKKSREKKYTSELIHPRLVTRKPANHASSILSPQVSIFNVICDWINDSITNIFELWQNLFGNCLNALFFQAPPTPLEIVQWETELPPALPLRQVSWICLLFFEHFLYFENNHFSSALLVTGVDFPRNSISNWFLLSPLSLSTLLRPSVERWISSSSSSSSSSSLSWCAE